MIQLAPIHILPLDKKDAVTRVVKLATLPDSAQARTDAVGPVRQNPLN